MPTDSNPVPYNTGKIKIGATYNPPRKAPYLDQDALLLQRALLGLKPTMEDRVSRFLGRYTGWVILAFILSCMLLVAAKGVV